jgi:hypothetical protein
MRQLIVATAMLVVALAVTFGTASVLQGVAMAKGPASNEPFVIIEAAKPGPASKATVNKERMTSQSRERSVSSGQVGL